MMWALRITYWSLLVPELDRFKRQRDRIRAIKDALEANEWVLVWARVKACCVILPIGFLVGFYVPPISRVTLWVILLNWPIGNWCGRKKMSLAIRRSLNKAGIPICVNCGYDMRGSTSGVCPECGKVLAEDLAEEEAKDEEETKEKYPEDEDYDDEEVIDDSKLG